MKVVSIETSARSSKEEERNQLREEFGGDGALIAKKLNAKVGSKVTEDDFLTWISGEGFGSYDKFHKAVVKLVGKEAAEAAEDMARLDNLLGYALKIKGYPDNVGGISMKKLLSKSKGYTKPASKTEKNPAKKAGAKLNKELKLAKGELKIEEKNLKDSLKQVTASKATIKELKSRIKYLEKATRK